MNTEPTQTPPDADGCICPQDRVVEGCPACDPDRTFYRHRQFARDLREARRCLQEDDAEGLMALATRTAAKRAAEGSGGQTKA